MPDPDLVSYLMNAFGMSEEAAIETIDLLINDERVDELTAGLEETLNRLATEVRRERRR